MIDVETVQTTHGRVLKTENIVTDVKRRLANTTVYKKPVQNDQNESCEESLDITRKWFETFVVCQYLTRRCSRHRCNTQRITNAIFQNRIP